jgi:hypothetical protein
MWNLASPLKQEHLTAQLALWLAVRILINISTVQFLTKQLTLSLQGSFTTLERIGMPALKVSMLH